MWVTKSNASFTEWCADIDKEAEKRGVSIPKKDYLIYSYQDGTASVHAVEDFIGCEKAAKDFNDSLKYKPCYVPGVATPIWDLVGEKERDQKRNQ